MREKLQKRATCQKNATILNKKRTYEVDRRQQMLISGIKEIENINVAEQTDRDHTQILEILKFLKVDSTITQIRLLKKTTGTRSGNRIILATMSTICSAQLVLARAKSLKVYNEKVYVSRVFC